MKCWFSAQSMPGGSAPLTFSDPGAVQFYQLQLNTRLNDMLDASEPLSTPFVAGFKTAQRLYEYYRPYKFKCKFMIDWLSTTSAIGTEYWDIFTTVSLDASPPWNLIFGSSSAISSTYAVEAARKNPLVRHKAWACNKNDIRKTRTVISTPTFSLKTLLGITPSFVFNATGDPTDVYSSSTFSAPTAGVYAHLLILRKQQTAGAPVYSVIITCQKNAKCVLFRRNNISSASGADANV